MLTGLLVIVLVQVCLSCPSEWVSFNDHCYYIKPSKAKLTYDMALDSCKDMEPESRLVTLETRDEYEFLKNHLSHEPSPLNDIDNGWLTSGRRVDGVWVWDTTGETIDQAVFDWGPHQPDNRTTSQQKCLSFWPKSEFKMADTFCWPYERQFICELEDQGFSVCSQGNQQELTKEDFNTQFSFGTLKSYIVRGSPIDVTGFKSSTLPMDIYVYVGPVEYSFTMDEYSSIPDGEQYLFETPSVLIGVTELTFLFPDDYPSVITCST